MCNADSCFGAAIVCQKLRIARRAGAPADIFGEMIRDTASITAIARAKSCDTTRLVRASFESRHWNYRVHRVGIYPKWYSKPQCEVFHWKMRIPGRKSSQVRLANRDSSSMEHSLL